MNSSHRHPGKNGDSARLGRVHRGLQPRCEILEGRLLLTLILAPEPAISSYAGVGFSLNPVALIYGSYNLQPDQNVSDYHVQINWGDGDTGDTSAALVALGVDGTSGLVGVRGSHVYKQQGTYNITVSATGPDGQTVSAQTTTAVVVLMPDAASQPITVPTAYKGAEPLGTGGPSLAPEPAISSYAGIGFSLNPVALIYGTYNFQADQKVSDYHAQINWGDGNTWDKSAELVALGVDGTSGLIGVRGSHVYKQQGTYDVVVYVTGPDGETISDQTTTAVVFTAPTLGNLSPSQWQVNQPGYDGTITVKGGSGSYQNLQVSGLPSGLSATVLGSTVNGQQSGTITISGTPTQSGMFTLTTTLQDGAGGTAQGTETLTITPTPTPTSPSPTSTQTGAAGGDGGEATTPPTPTLQGGLQINPDTFIEQYRKQFAAEIKKTGLSQTAINGLKQLIGFINQDENIKDVRWAAYELATVKAETSRFQPVSESRSLWKEHDRYLKKQKKWDYGHPVPAPDGVNQIYYGRGYVQLTWKANYLKMGDALQIGGSSDALADDPSLALDPQNAYEILSYGMINGSFTGAKLSDYIPVVGPPDYYNARRIINGLDRAATIAGYAGKFEAALTASMSNP